ncbi:GreA/GreB family elongation factor [Flavobacteriaceae bacterium XHP0103]|uniref:GreA/GreB family elongation factor n=1 Tax=Marixanthotalea marina TaxID=2844359 RepID=UPI002989D378|nr:GreA/GreB family elongation factor [Marixanthotalea marina]MBU3822240.1 GreA/GreB family elongation factor [Marixanthotalea marina]
MTTKQKLLQVCNEYVDKRINDYRNEIHLIKDSIASNDQKESDDDDSGNGKLFNDLEKNMEHLNDATKTKEHLKLVKVNVASKEAVLGSIVKTDVMNFYIATSIGKIEVDGDTYYAISFHSPIGQLLKHKSAGDTFEFNQKKYKILEII